MTVHTSPSHSPKNVEGQRPSPWTVTAEVPEYGPLTADTRCDVCIVGAGIAGLSTAYLLAREGKTVVVLERGAVGGGETSRTTAHLSNAIDDRYSEIERLHGVEGARVAAESHTAAIELIETIVAHEGIDCDFSRVDGYLITAPGSSGNDLERELEAARKAGLGDVGIVPRAPLRGYDTGTALRFPRQAQFHPLNYLAGLARAIEKYGGRIYAGTHVSKVEGGSQVRIETENGLVVLAGAAVVATNSPINDFVITHLKQAPYRTYVIAGRVPRGTVPPMLLWDTLDAYHYVRLQYGAEASGDFDLLIVGGEDHKTGQPDQKVEGADEASIAAGGMASRWTALEQWARERFPTLGPIEFRWSGQVMETIDGLALIGKTPTQDPNVYIATGDSGMGMTHGTIAGILLSDLILRGKHPWQKIYDPMRLRLGAVTEMVRENVNVAAQYAGLLSGGDVESVEAIAPGSGAVVRRGLNKIAAYRDEQGALHQMSAVCTHAGCVVQWNHVEASWDCPCHGSRFDRFGSVINGPAASDLAAVEAEAPPAAD